MNSFFFFFSSSNCNKDSGQPKQVLSSSGLFFNVQATPQPRMIAIYGNLEPSHNTFREEKTQLSSAIL